MEALVALPFFLFFKAVGLRLYLSNLEFVFFNFKRVFLCFFRLVAALSLYPFGLKERAPLAMYPLSTFP